MQYSSIYDFPFKQAFSKFYLNLVEKRIKHPAIGYVEEHHIIPTSIGGSDEKWNLVKLTAREHFICHLLLLRMLSGNHRGKMIFAAHNMMYWKSESNQRVHKISGRTYQILKEKVSQERRKPLTDEEKAKFTPERMKNTWAHIWRTYMITFTDGSIMIVDDLTKWCKETGHSLTALRKALKGDGIVLSDYAKGHRGSGCKPSKLDGVKIVYLVNS